MGWERSFNEEFQGFEIVFVAGHLKTHFHWPVAAKKIFVFMGTAGISDSEIAIAS